MTTAPSRAIATLARAHNEQHAHHEWLKSVQAVLPEARRLQARYPVLGDRGAMIVARYGVDGKWPSQRRVEEM